MTARPPLEVADIFRQYGADFRSRYLLLPEQRRVMQAIEVCCTAGWSLRAMRLLLLSTHRLQLLSQSSLSQMSVTGPAALGQRPSR